MKLIVMLQGMGINERGWAMLASKFAKVVLIQQGFVTHVEIWESGQRVFNGPDTMFTRWRLLDEILIGTLSALRTLFLALKFTKGQRIDTIVAANYHNSLAAILLRFFGKTRTVVPFLTDYLPPRGSLSVRLHRRLTTYLMGLVSKHADEVWLLAPRIPSRNPRSFVVPIYISERQSEPRPRDEVVYIGYPSYDHALDILFQICAKHGFKLNIIGDSPYLQSIKHLAPPGTVFHGLMNDEERIGQILSKCFCAYAVYRDLSPNSYSYYGFPSKTLYSFANNVPIVITNVAHFNHTYEEKGVGRVVEPAPEKIEEAMLQLKEQYAAFSRAIDRFRTEWNAHVENFHRERLAALGASNEATAAQPQPKIEDGG